MRTAERQPKAGSWPLTLWWQFAAFMSLDNKAAITRATSSSSLTGMRFQEHWSQSVDDVPGRWRFSLPLSLCPPAQTSVNLCGGKGKRPEKGVARVSQKSNWNLRASLITGHLISFIVSVNKFLHICFSEMCGHYKYLYLCIIRCVLGLNNKKIIETERRSFFFSFF